jgi:hypothetical protein
VSTQNESKLTKLLQHHKPGTVCLPAWLEKIGISRDLQKRYRHSGWLQSIGTGALKRPDDEVHWQGGVYALQTQAELPIHPGAATALSMQGFAHFARFSHDRLFLFSPRRSSLPAWFRTRDWGVPLTHVKTSMLPEHLGLTDYAMNTFAIRVSCPERAILECLYLAPDDMDLLECFQLMEGLVNLQPRVVQELLMACISVKATRLFLYMADKAKHKWLPHIDTSKLNLGKGHRRLAKDGVFISQYNLTIPKQLAQS